MPDALTTGLALDGDIHPVVVDRMARLLPYIPKNIHPLFEPRQHLPLLGDLAGRSPRFVSLLKADATVHGGGVPGSDPNYMLEHHFDAHGVGAGLLLPLEASHLSTWTNPDEGAIVATAVNELFASEWLPVDRRFRLALVVSPHDAVLAAKEIRRLGPNPQIGGVWIPMINRLLGDRHFYPIYEAAQELGLAIVLHPGSSEGEYIGCATFAGGNPTHRHERYGLLGQFAASNITSLIFEGVFERFPDTKFIFTEYGWTWAPALIWRLDSVWKAGRSTVPWVRRAPSEYVLDHIRFTTEPALEPPTEREALQVLESLHAERTLIYSSDYPHWDGDADPGMVFRSAPKELRRRIFRENALETYGPRMAEFAE